MHLPVASLMSHDNNKIRNVRDPALTRLTLNALAVITHLDIGILLSIEGLIVSIIDSTTVSFKP